MSPHLHRPSLVARVPLRAARWSASHPWRAIGAWFAFVALAVALAALISTKQTTDADYRIGESGRADAMQASGGFADDQTESVLVTARDGGKASDAQVDAIGRQLRTRLSGLHGVTNVTPPQWNAAHTAALVDVHVKSTVDDVSQIQARVAQIARARDDLRVREAGDVSVNTAINDRVADDLHSAEGISLPITVLLMLLAFGALIAAGVPILLAVTSVAATMGISAPLSHLIHAEPTVTSMIVLIGMAVGVDYSLFYLKREREERAAGHTTLDAVEIAAATSGHSILVSGAAVVASMAGLFIVGGATFDSLATGAIVVVAVAVIGSVTVLPALLAKLGRWTDRPRVPLLWRVNRRITRRLGQGGISRRILGPVLRRPVAALVVSLAALVALAAPALGMKVHDANLDTLPASIPQVQTLREIADEFPSQGAAATVVVHGTRSERGQVVDALRRLSTSAAATPSFDKAGDGAIQTAPDGETVRVVLPIPYSESDDRSGAAVQQLRDRLVPDALSGMHVQHAVGGDVAESLDYATHQSDRLPYVIGFVLLLTLVMMTMAFRSLVVAALSSALNLLSVGVAFGILTLVFQHGWFAGPLGFTTPGFVIDWIPLFVMVVLVGLSMDYNVFVLARIREHAVRGLPARLAVERGVTDTAGVITSAASVMVSVFAIFMTLSMLEMKMMGVALAASILIDATLIRLVILPAALVLLGERAWWPGRVRRPHGAVVEPEHRPEPVGAR
ncbi:MAG TPA: MMPL family transporter [Nocardioides sp.]|jgi:RND superfamily putative drug exporter|uniref:MMPL family transporter n=1 Tax=Nocardioides sp. TaxID=35761 RepID=UPI002E33606F|nr:MMPL family transporter [Nocardioides sp.]HEX3932238.1 MMPL family transporter [Nocardioides sp.]